MLEAQKLSQRTSLLARGKFLTSSCAFSTAECTCRNVCRMTDE
jgi:hypothetical protein